MDFMNFQLYKLRASHVPAPLGIPIKGRLPDLPGNRPYGTNSNPIMSVTYCAPSSRRYYASHGILTMCPSRAAFAIRLGPTNPWLTIIAKETLVFRRRGFSPLLWLLVPTFLLPNAPPWVAPLASSRLEYSPTARFFLRKNAPSVSVHNLSLDHLRRIFS